MKKFLFSWFAGMLVILIFCFLVIGVPTLIGFIGLPDWVVFAYFFDSKHLNNLENLLS